MRLRHHPPEKQRSRLSGQLKPFKGRAADHPVTMTKLLAAMDGDYKAGAGWRKSSGGP
jgi:hypothetical protein